MFTVQLKLNIYSNSASQTPWLFKKEEDEGEKDARS